MCARYEIDSPAQKIIERFGLSVPPFAFKGFQPANDVRPTNAVPAIGPDATALILHWGLSVSWQTQPIINARVETLEEKPTFQPLLNQRVLIPATAYFEWRRDGRAKIRTRIAPEGEGLFAMAGLQSDNRCVILTCAPASSIAYIHNRMPVMLTPSQEAEWINPDLPFEDLSPALQPYSDSLEVSEPDPAPRQHDLFT